MRWCLKSSAVIASVILACLPGCEAQPPPAPIAKPPALAAEPVVLDPVHLGEDRLRSPLLEGLRQQIEHSETDQTREVTQSLAQQLDDADVILSEAQRRNRAAIQQANRQVRLGAARLSPSFVLLTVDRLGVGDLGCYGQTRWATPALDKFASTGLRFTQCYAGVNPTASQSLLLTGNSAPLGGTIRVTDLMPKILWNASYQTALIGEWPEGTSPVAQGYEDSSGWDVSPGAFPSWALLNGKHISLESNVNGQQQVSPSDFLSSEVRSYLRQARSRPNPFFLHVSLRLFDDVAVHPLTAEDYATRIQQIDALAKHILDAIDEFRLASQTCVFFTALAGPHPNLTQLVRETRSTSGLSHSSAELREGNLRVPLLVRWPNQIPAGSASESVVGLWDILPTLAKLSWVSRPMGRIDGRSLAEVLRQNQTLAARRVAWKSSADGSVLAVREENWKVVRIDASTFQLFDLTTDQAEQHNVAAEHAEILQRLIKQ